jgi:hypothetical protein
MQSAAYNSRINFRSNSRSNFRAHARGQGMGTLFPSRFVGSFWLVLALILTPPADAQNWADAEAQLAAKIVSAAGRKSMAVEVLNRSSLSPAATEDIRRNLLTQLAVLGARFVTPEQAAATVRVSLSEDLQSYVWVAEIRQGTNAASIVMVSPPRSAPLSVEPEAAAMVLRRIPLWSQPERILDVAVAAGNPARLLVLDGGELTSYRFQDNRWQLEQSLPIAHSRTWPRDLRGRLILANNKDLVFEAYLPGVHCRSSANGPSAMTCYDSDDPSPVGSDLAILNATFASTRNFFSGALSPAVGKQTTAPAFYSAAAVPRAQGTSWLLAAVDGQVHLLDGITDQVVEKLGWGSDIASVHSGCGSGWQVLATGTGDGRNDTVRAFEMSGREPIAVSAPLDVSGTITALWTESGGASAVAVTHNSETERYEAFRLILACSR